MHVPFRLKDFTTATATNKVIPITLRHFECSSMNPKMIKSDHQEMNITTIIKSTTVKYHIVLIATFREIAKQSETSNIRSETSHFDSPFDASMAARLLPSESASKPIHRGMFHNVISG